MKCPFCLTDNRCALGDNQSCWCFSITVPEAMLGLLPLPEQGAVCVCQSCIALYNKDKAEFLQRFGFV